MNMPRPRLIINAFAMAVPSHNFFGMWRMPYALAHPYNEIQTWIDIAETAERGKLDGIFLADHVGLTAPWGGSHRLAAAGGFSFPNDDAFVICSALATRTTHLALGFTSSVIQSNPYNFARQISTLDNISGGRTAWNLVTSALENSYRNVGFEKLPSHEERYARAFEYLQAVYALWEGSWDDGAIVRDVENGVFVDSAKVHPIDFKGEYFSVQGPLHSTPSPQRTPFIYTPGLSDTALALAGAHAEGLFMSLQNLEAMRFHGERARAAVKAAGRDAGDLKLIQSTKIVVGSTMAEAEAKLAAIREWADPITDLMEISGIAGVDLSGVDPDEQLSVEELARSAPGFKGALGMANIRPDEKTISMHELASRTQAAPIVGTPEFIADELEKWQDAGADGINIADYQFHEGYVDFVDHVIPVLQERGLAQREYADGSFRNQVFGRGDRLPSTHPAAKHRGAYPTSID